MTLKRTSRELVETEWQAQSEISEVKGPARTSCQVTRHLDGVSNWYRMASTLESSETTRSPRTACLAIHQPVRRVFWWGCWGGINLLSKVFHATPQPLKNPNVVKAKRRPSVKTHEVSLQRLTAPAAPGSMVTATSYRGRFQLRLLSSYWTPGVLKSCWVSFCWVNSWYSRVGEPRTI